MRDEEGEFWLEDSYGLHEQERLVKSLLAKDDSEFLLCEQVIYFFVKFFSSFVIFSIFWHNMNKMRKKNNNYVIF